MKYSVSSEEDLATLNAADRKQTQHYDVPNNEDTKRVGRERHKGFDAVGDNSKRAYELRDYRPKSRTERDPYVGIPIKEFNKMYRLCLRERGQKLNRSGTSARLEETINNNNNKDGRRVPEGEAQRRKGRFNMAPLSGKNQCEEVFQSSAQVGFCGP
jgi:hypothetical protein